MATVATINRLLSLQGLLAYSVIRRMIAFLFCAFGEERLVPLGTTAR